MFISEASWKEIFMNFIIDLFLSKRDKVVYDLIFMIIDRYIKMIKYLSVSIKIDVSKLTNVFFEKIVLHFDISADIVSDKNSLFINTFWSTLCYYAKIKRWLNITFHSQTDDQIKKQNQILKYYLRSYANAKQSN